MSDSKSIDDFEELREEEPELFEHHRVVADKGQSLMRLDKFLMIRLESVSRNKVQNAARAGNILVNNKPEKPNYRVKPNDVITVVLSHPPQEFDLIAEDIPLNIVYEDDDIVVVNKVAGMVVHPGYGNYTGTLVNALLFHFEQNDKGKTAGLKPYLVHRIDKDTSGIMIVAKNELAQAKLAREFFDHTIERKYNALVWGDFQEEEGTIIGNLARSAADRRVMSVYADENKGKHAVTHYKVLERFRYVTLVECELETGRTHQIRAHMKHIGHPLFNDIPYGGGRILKGTTFSKYKQFIENCFKILPRQALHARSLGFVHPSSGEKIFFDSEPPADMNEVILKWRNYLSNQIQ